MHILFLFAGEWITLASNVPVMAYYSYWYSKLPQISLFNLYDHVNIMNPDVLITCMRVR